MANLPSAYPERMAWPLSEGLLTKRHTNMPSIPPYQWNAAPYPDAAKILTTYIFYIPMCMQHKQSRAGKATNSISSMEIQAPMLSTPD
jgi:hypothetical protein